jgi:uncharacterized protein YbaR (Trm112 family)
MSGGENEDYVQPVVECQSNGELHEDLSEEDNSQEGNVHDIQVREDISSDDEELQESEEDEDFSPSFNLDDNNLDTVVSLSDGVCARDILLLALGMSKRHNWSYETLINHLQCQNSLLNIPCLPQSKTKLWSVLKKQAGSEMHHHAYCNACKYYLGLRINLPTLLAKGEYFEAVLGVRSRLHPQKRV